MATNDLDFNRFALFGDEVYSSTDLNRRAGEVLDHARRGPVTISRNKEQFALIKREQAAEWVKALGQVGPVLELLDGALCRGEGKQTPSNLSWLKAFDTDDLRKMIREVLVASIAALRETGDWELVNSIIHEWHESGLAVTRGVLEAARNSPADESPLADPREILDAENTGEPEIGDGGR